MNSATPNSDLERRILSLGSEIFTEVEESKNSSFNSDNIIDQLMDWSMRDKDFKTSLFRFVGVFPDLRSSSSIIKHAKEYFDPVAENLPLPLRLGLSVNPKSVTASVGARLVRKQISAVASRFILGSNPYRALPKLDKLRRNGIGFTIDLLGEASVSEEEALAYQKKYLELLEALSGHMHEWTEPLIEGHTGETTPLNISVKLSALYSQIKPVSTEHSVKILKNRLRPILTRAKKFGVYVYLDMEDSSMTSIIIDTFKSILSEEQFLDYQQVGLVLQAYMRRTEDDLLKLIEWAKRQERRIGVRLVKGAYWDSESALSKQHSWPSPVWLEKANSDYTYEKLSRLILKNNEWVYSAFASHNTRSLCHAIACAESLGVSKTDYELQMLYGMAGPIKKAFVKRGFLVRDYTPVGDLVPGMAYLVRRLLENTSNEGFLNLRFNKGETPEHLFKNPLFDTSDTGEKHLNKTAREEFSNAPFLDFSVTGVRGNFKETLEKTIGVIKAKPRPVFPIVDGLEIKTKSQIDSTCPDDSSFVLGRSYLAGLELSEKALQSLSDFHHTWRDTQIETRQEILFKAAELITQQRERLASLIVLEASKQWTAADADVAEAIDFLNYYAHQAKELFQRKKIGNIPGEFNQLSYEPRGVSLVISPWNFPLAIPCGMLSAALVTGNCAILKPAEQTPVIAQELFKILLQAGLPPRAAAFLPGRGEVLGEYLVKHPRISTIVFTGSKQVGLGIIEKAAKTTAEQTHVKRVIAEMGGKNAIIIDEDADLDEAVKGTVHSAFGFQGQKCSACSRIIVVSQKTYEVFSKRLASATKSINLGSAQEPTSFLSSVINSEERKRILGVIERAKKSLQLLAQGSYPEGTSETSSYVPPTVFTKTPKEHFLLKEEVFGPVACVQIAKTFKDALEMAIDSEYALTGAIFSRSPKNIELAQSEFKVGNLYINRGSTGALVGRQPFGGARMSGVGSKAGGEDYLKQFVYPRVITENTMRRGFVPDL